MNREIISFFEQIGVTHPNILKKENLCPSFFLARKRMAHKGDFGHGLLIAGSYGKAGAGVLSAFATLKIGCGLLTCHIPQKLYDIFQISVPEAMISFDKDKEFFSLMPDTKKYSAIAIGPGLDTKTKTKQALFSFLMQRKDNATLQNIPLVLDADALNIIAESNKKVEILQNNIILTPHPKEFERLFGKMQEEKKIKFMTDFSKQHNITIILKGGLSTISAPSGALFFNVLGNPGMATAGSGDVLTGIILGILCQGFSCEESAKIGVYLHALSGDKAKNDLGEKSLMARDIINFLPKAIND